jgi:hypothetical protein
MSLACAREYPVDETTSLRLLGDIVCTVSRVSPYNDCFDPHGVDRNGTKNNIDLLPNLRYVLRKEIDDFLDKQTIGRPRTNNG